MDPFENFKRYWTEQVLMLGGTYENGIMRCPVPAFPFNGAMEFSGSRDEAKAIVEELKQGEFTWYLWPGDDYEDILIEAGLTNTGGFEAVIHRDPESLGEPQREVEFTTDIPAWASVLRRVHSIDDNLSLEASFEPLLNDDRFEMLLVRDPEPAGVGMLFVEGRTAGLYAGAVLDSHRRRGIASSMIAAGARRRDVDTLVAVTTPDGLALSMAMGFEAVGHIGQYIWVN